MSNKKKNEKYFFILSIVFMILIMIIYLCFRLQVTKKVSEVDFIIFLIISLIISFLTSSLEVVVEEERLECVISKEYSFKENVKNILTSQYKIKDFNNEDDEYYAKEDCQIFSAYDTKIELPECYIQPYGIEYEDVLRMERKDKEIIFFGNEDENIRGYGYGYKYRSYSVTYYMELGILKEIDNKKRLHIKTNESIPSEIKKFEDVFEDLEKDVKETDEKYKKEYEAYINRKYNNKTVDNNLDTEYLKLTEVQKQFLLELYKQTKLDFSLVLDNGLMRIYVSFEGNVNDYKKINKEVICERISNIFIKLIEEF